MHMSYWRFAAMIATSTVVMFGLMYLNTYALEHVRFSETRGYMALMMGAAMAVIMLTFMLSMYKKRIVNIAILGVAAVVFAGSLWLVRSQATVEDVAYMKGMIPHHSIAIMTSKRHHPRPARTSPRRRDHRSPGPGDRRDGTADRRSGARSTVRGRARAAVLPSARSRTSD